MSLRVGLFSVTVSCYINIFANGHLIRANYPESDEKFRGWRRLSNQPDNPSSVPRAVISCDLHTGTAAGVRTVHVVQKPIGPNVYKYRIFQLRVQQLMDLESAAVLWRLVLNVLKARMAELIISKDLNTWLLKSETQRYRNSSFWKCSGFFFILLPSLALLSSSPLCPSFLYSSLPSFLLLSLPLFCPSFSSIFWFTRWNQTQGAVVRVWRPAALGSTLHPRFSLCSTV